VIVERLAQTGHIAVAEYAETAATDAGSLAIDFNELCGEVADNRLRRCQFDGGIALGHINHPVISFLRVPAFYPLTSADT